MENGRLGTSTAGLIPAANAYKSGRLSAQLDRAEASHRHTDDGPIGTARGRPVRGIRVVRIVSFRHHQDPVGPGELCHV